MEELIGQFATLVHIKKIGEGTFGEAFKADQVQPSPLAPLPVPTTMPCYLQPTWSVARQVCTGVPSS